MTTTYACPNGHQSADPEWCDTCGAKLDGAAAPTSSDPAAEGAGRDGARAETAGAGAGAGAESAGAAAAESARASAPEAAPAGGGQRAGGSESAGAGAVADPSLLPAGPGAVVCPHCSTPNPPDNLFCEQCGYDFTTGQTPPEPERVAATPPSTPVSGAKWVVIIEIDPLWYALKGALADQPCPSPSSSTATITGHTALVGRTSQSRGLRPEVALDADTGVSRRHAQFVREGDGLKIIDLSSTNGTYVVTAGDEPTEDLEPVAPGTPVALADGDRVYVGAWSRLTVRAG